MSTDQQDLRDRIADALYTAPADPTDAAERIARRTAQRDADAVMPMITTDLGERDARIRALENTIAGRDSRITELESRLARSQTHRADLTRENGYLQALAATELTRHDQGHGLYDHETTTAPTHGGHTP